MKVTKFKVGDEVFGEINFNKCGCAAQYCLWEDKELSLKPKNMDFTKAASLPGNQLLLVGFNSLVVVGFTAINGITKKGELKSGERVLVIGAAGGASLLHNNDSRNWFFLSSICQSPWSLRYWGLQHQQCRFCKEPWS